MRGLLAWLLGAVLVFSGCADRHAGTETGNPEITVVASFSVLEYGTTLTSEFNLRVMGMGYTIARQSGPPDTGECWTRPGGTLANFAGWGAPPLPDTILEDEGPWLQAEIVLRTPEGPAEIPASADIETWSSPRYSKFDLFSMEGRRTVLFEMPQGVEYRLQFDIESTEEWRFNDTLDIPFFFDASSWTDTLITISRYTTRRDVRNAPYLLLSPTENAAAWHALKARLPKSFYADSVIVR